MHDSLGPRAARTLVQGDVWLHECRLDKWRALLNLLLGRTVATCYCRVLCGPVSFALLFFHRLTEAFTQATFLGAVGLTPAEKANLGLARVVPVVVAYKLSEGARGISQLGQKR